MTTTYSPAQRYPEIAIGVGRIIAGLSTWLLPRFAWRVFGLGVMTADGSTGMMTRLFGIRDLILGAAVFHPDASVRQSVIQAGIAIDTADIAANLIAVRNGAPKSTLLGVASGAASFVVLGAVSLTRR